MIRLFVLFTILVSLSAFSVNPKSKSLNNNIFSIRKPVNSDDLNWNLGKIAFSLLPLAPGDRRKTIKEEIVKDTIWTFDQIQGVVNVNVPVRSTIIRLKKGGLFVYNPVAPTKEYVDMIRTLEDKWGPVKIIVLGSLGLEHKAFVGAFSRYFKQAEIFLQPGQWSFPINLPSFLYGFPLNKKLNEIPVENKNSIWSEEFDHVSIGPLRFKSVGGFGETAFLHRSTSTLLVTDAVIKVEDEPPSIIQEDPRALLFHSRDKMTDKVLDTIENRRKGWRRMALFGLVFYPSGIKVSGVKEAFDQIPKVSPEMRLLGDGAIPIDGALYPWSWVKSDIPNFKSLQGGLLVAPILQKLILDREPEKVLKWVNTIQNWKFKRIIPCHFANNIKTNGNEFRKAFSFLDNKSYNGPKASPDDLALLNAVSDIFTKLGIVAESKISQI